MVCQVYRVKIRKQVFLILSLEFLYKLECTGNVVMNIIGSTLLSNFQVTTYSSFLYTICMLPYNTSEFFLPLGQVHCCTYLRLVECVPLYSVRLFPSMNILLRFYHFEDLRLPSYHQRPPTFSPPLYSLTTSYSHFKVNTFYLCRISRRTLQHGYQLL